MFLLVLMLVTAGKFQTGKLVGGTLAESEQTAMQPIPKPIAVGRANVGRLQRLLFRHDQPI